jgi:cobalt-zinc-cadmium efflux system protein
MLVHDHVERATVGREGDRQIKSARMAIVAVLNVFISAAELVGGILSGSLSLLSDSLHNFSDTAAILTSWGAMRIAGRERSIRKTYGYQRAEVLAAFVNAAFLLVLSLFLLAAAFGRFKNPSRIDGSLMMIIAAIGLGANLLSALLLKRNVKGSMNVRSSYLHMLSDTVSSVGVLVGAIAVRLWGVVWIDPLITVLVALYIIKETWIIVREAVDILMQSSADIDYTELKKDVESISAVINIHHVHTWRSDEKTVYLEGHVDLCDMMLSKTGEIYEAIERLLISKYGVSHATIQFETDRCGDKEVIRL